MSRGPQGRGHHLGDAGTAGHSEQQQEVGTGLFLCLLSLWKALQGSRTKKTWLYCFKMNSLT